MSHSDSKNIEPQTEEEVLEETNTAEDIETAEEEAADQDSEADEESETDAPEQSAASSMPADPRFSKLMKMRDQYVTEDALRSTEEKPKPEPTQGPQEIDEEEFGEFEDDEFDEEFDEEEEHDEHDDYDDFEDDDYEDEELNPSVKKDEPPAKPEPAAEAETEVPQEEEKDHKLAKLRKLNTTFVTDEDLEHAASMKEHTYYKDVEVAKVLCPNCQSEENRTDKICSSCGAKLPNITAIREEKYNPGTLNAAVMKYHNAVDMLRDGTWEADDFIEFLFERSELSASHIDGIMEVIEESGSAEWLPQATKLIMDSTLLLEESIDVMLGKVKFTQDEQPYLESEYDELCVQYDEVLEQAEEDETIEIPEPPEPPLEAEERIKMIDFAQELVSIKQANAMMLESLRLIDKFQQDEDPDFSM